MSQATFFEDDATIQARFLRFHAENPHVYRLLCRFARELRQKGYVVAAVGLIWERMRWELHFTTTDADFKLNDHYRSRYARLIMAQEPDLKDFFRTRALRAA